jgi:hypothetical protein
MNTLNALGFLLCGVGMILGPTLVPALFSADTLSGASSGLWVEFMGWVNGLAGAGYLVVSRLVAFGRRSLAWPAEQLEANASAMLRPVLVGRVEADLRVDRRRAA